MYVLGPLCNLGSFDLARSSLTNWKPLISGGTIMYRKELIIVFFRKRTTAMRKWRPRQQLQLHQQPDLELRRRLRQRQLRQPDLQGSHRQVRESPVKSWRQLQQDQQHLHHGFGPHLRSRQGLLHLLEGLHRLQEPHEPLILALGQLRQVPHPEHRLQHQLHEQRLQH